MWVIDLCTRWTTARYDDDDDDDDDDHDDDDDSGSDDNDDDDNDVEVHDNVINNLDNEKQLLQFVI